MPLRSRGLPPGLAPLLVAALLARCRGIVAPSTSLATVPVAYFGGNAAPRPEANLQMLAKMRLSERDKWGQH